MKNKLYITAYIALLLTSSCTDQIDVKSYSEFSPAIYPDYKDVTIPVNMAPLNFFVCDTTVDRAILTAGHDNIYVKVSDNKVDIPEGKWHDMLSNNAGDTLSITLCHKTAQGYEAYKPFHIAISQDSIDPVIVYRLIPPGYALWNRMGIYQRRLESFEEKCIYNNRYGKGNCVNCHSFHQGNPSEMMFHLRKRHAGTYIYMDGEMHKINADMSQQLSNPVYPYWHPSGRYIAFSTNKTFQMFHSTDPNIIEVGDDASDIIIYDIEKDQIITTKSLSSPDAFETFPCFSPDGSTLYFCSAQAVDSVERNYKEVKYSLCSISFDLANRSFGTEVDTIYNASEGRSATFPRVSPDGKYLTYTISDYGTFPIWHKDADLSTIDIATREAMPMNAINSNDVESYHSWSSNSRWIVFSSRRDDGLYTRPYFSHINEDGTPDKPFMLPQRDPMNHYLMQGFSYNIPELIKGEVDLDEHTTASKLSPIW